MNDTRFEELQRIAGDVPRETFDLLALFEARFCEWNRRINLTSGADVRHLWHRHILDSAQLVPLAPARPIWLDLGSGGGFPGIIAAIILKDTAGAHVHLVESNRKKAAFLASIVAETGIPAKVHACRIEDMQETVPPIRIVTARAVADLNTLLNLAEPWLGADAIGLFQKGRDYLQEIKDCRDGWSFDLIEHPSRTDPGGIILEIANLRKHVSHS